MRIETVTGPENEPLLLADVKDHLRIDHDEDDAYLMGLVMTARHTVEVYAGLCLINRTVHLYLNAWPDARTGNLWWDGMADGSFVSLIGAAHIALPVSPVSSVSLLEVHNGSAYISQDPASYYLQPGKMPRLYQTKGGAWPRPGKAADGIRITLEAGYGESWNAVPPALRQALLRTVSHLYRNRGDEPRSAMMASGVAPLLQPFRRLAL